MKRLFFVPLSRLMVATFLWLLPAAGARADFSFVHLSDTHVGATDASGSNAAKDAALLGEIRALKPTPAFAINTGDVCEIGTDAEYAVWRKTRRSLDPVRIYDAPGNHDVRWNPRGKEGFVRGAGQPLYQSWDKENVHFVTLDSTVLLQHWGHFDQAMLDWLKADLAKTGTAKPVVIGFHHWIGRDTVMVDNENALLALLAPYNVRLFLIGHGHSDIAWNINGVPAIMAKGLYQGSYNLVEVNKDRLRVLRRTTAKTTPTLVMTIPLARAQKAPSWSVDVRVERNKGLVSVESRDLPPTAKLAFRLNTSAYTPLTPAAGGWTGSFSTAGLAPGEHTVTVQTALPTGETYQLPVVLALSAPGGARPVWSAHVGGAVQSKLVHANGTLFVSSMGGDLLALDPLKGGAPPRWRARTGGALFSTPAVANNVVYVGSADHFVYAFDARTGKQLWRTETGGAVFAGAAVAQNIVCIASTDTKVYGLDAKTGRVVWSARGEGMYQSQAATDGGRFFVGGWDNFLRCLDVKTGRELWRQKFGSAFYFAPAIGSPTVGAGKVFVSSNDGMLHAVDAASGDVVWEVGPLVYGDLSAPASLALGYSGPLYHDGRIYNASLTGKGYVFCFDAQTGRKIWESPTGSVIYDSSCAFSGGNLYVGSVEGTFSCLRANDGAVRWQYRLGPGHLLASPAVDDRRVFIGSLSGQVVALPLTPLSVP